MRQSCDQVIHTVNKARDTLETRGAPETQKGHSKHLIAHTSLHLKLGEKKSPKEMVLTRTNIDV